MDFMVCMVGEMISKRFGKQATRRSDLSENKRFHNTSLVETIQPVISLKGPLKTIHKKEGLFNLEQSDRPNGVMGVGLESDNTKYGPDFLPYYIEWMAENIQNSFFIIGDAELKFNAGVFGLGGCTLRNGELAREVKRISHRKNDELMDVISKYGSKDRMYVLLRTDINSARWYELLMSAIPERNELFEKDIDNCLIKNMASRLENHKRLVGQEQFKVDYERMKQYPLTEVAGLLEIFSNGLTIEGIDHVIDLKVGPPNEGLYDRIVSRFYQGGKEFRYRESDSLLNISEKFRQKRGDRPLSWAYFNFSNPD